MRTYRTQETSYIIGVFRLNVKTHSPIFIKKIKIFYTFGILIPKSPNQTSRITPNGLTLTIV